MISRFKIRQTIEDRENNLSPYAVKSRLSRGRSEAEESCPIRTAFQRDRDRIIHTNAFRRLKHKTQVFISPLGDHFVTRLTHTLEVSQIARTISRALNLNEDLTEAIALGHDLGHTPFGHVGEDTLDKLYPGGFRHNKQSLRVVDTLENGGNGLNLSWEVRDGILKHSKDKSDIQDIDSVKPATFEGQICRLADAIAYINHDIGDAIRAGVLHEHDLPAGPIKILGFSHSKRVHTMVCDVIVFSWPTSGKIDGIPEIGMSMEILEATNQLRNYLFETVYNELATRDESLKARETIHLLYYYFKENGDKLPPEYNLCSAELERRVVDYIAGMTDQYARNRVDELNLRDK
ncbi:deoxyguanosinetriphosphate triphosphohydrolase [Chloroflexota bacterium]